MKLTNAKLRSLPIGKTVGDGGGLYYQPTANNKGKWSYRFAINGKSHEMGLRTYPEISLKEARLTHAEQRKVFVSGRNPIETRRQTEQSQKAKGSLFQFDVMLDYDTEDFYVAASGSVKKFEAAQHDYSASAGLNSLISEMSKSLYISDNISAKIAFFIEALLSDEADDLDESGVDYRWVDFPNTFLSMNNDLGKPENRVHIRVKSNTFGHPVSCSVNDESLEFSKDDLGMGLAISGFEQSD